MNGPPGQLGASVPLLVGVVVRQELGLAQELVPRKATFRQGHVILGVVLDNGGSGVHGVVALHLVVLIDRDQGQGDVKVDNVWVTPDKPKVVQATIAKTEE